VSDGGSRLVAESGLVVEAGRAAAGVTDGAPALAAVRPEHVMLGDEEPTGDCNKVAGRVAAAVMLGDSMEYVLRLADGTELTSRRSRDTPGLPSQGSQVWLSWTREWTTVFPLAGTAARGRPATRPASREAAE
jgi:hypothetical protein